MTDKRQAIGIHGEDIDKIMSLLIDLAGHKTHTAAVMASYALVCLIHARTKANRSEAVLELHDLFDQAWQHFKEAGNPLTLAAEGDD